MKQNRNRRQARLYAFQSLYAKEFHKAEDIISVPRAEEVNPTQGMDVAYAEAIIQGVEANKMTIDALLQSHSPKRKISQLGAVERNVLRLATWELTISDEAIDPRIIINEAIQLTKDYGAEKSYKFVNAVLDAIAKQKVKTSALPED
ncbi:transcription antitermination factor NusB [Veillonella criceti]|uniref:Transcription antitermination protein NusB n=1 Tax=Veillonella criceti TaxID=103891 RepID=A0A380NH00_9FIRM|nr:transcription antitermination factor NusB [Veillonella criceti]SUP40871.1 N utilization substance protein B homolog [Veillonella criceti]